MTRDIPRSKVYRHFGRMLIAVALLGLIVLGIVFRLAKSGTDECIAAAAQEEFSYYGVEHEIRWFPPGWHCQYFDLENDRVATIEVSFFS